MRSIGCFFVFMWLFLGGCMLERGALSSGNDAGIAPDAAWQPPTLEIEPYLPFQFNPAPVPLPIALWPRSHPVGTLLVDHVGDLWVVIEDGLRAPVSGDDTLGAISLDEYDATPMTLEEERCLTPVDDYWSPDNWDWWPVYGPDEADPGPFILNGADHTRRPVCIEALESWGYYWRWMDYFDGGEDEWSSYVFVDEPIPLRDGTLVHTEHGFYYVVHGRSFYFRPSDLVAEAGYHPESALWMRDARLRELAPTSTALDYDTFNRCPADEL